MNKNEVNTLVTQASLEAPCNELFPYICNEVERRTLERAAKTVESYCGAWDDQGFALATAIRALKEVK
jgi:hypothetical protein